MPDYPVSGLSLYFIQYMHRELPVAQLQGGQLHPGPRHVHRSYRQREIQEYHQHFHFFIMEEYGK